MATYNGARFLEKQLGSILEQTHKNVSLWISDDGSTDDTLDVVKAFADAHADVPVHLLDGPGRGAAQNFMSLLQNNEIEADYFSFADQDDVWFPDKLERAIALAPAGAQSTARPFLYGSRTIVTDTELQQIAPSILNGTKIGFANALVQNFAAGNTMVFNAAARALLPDGATMHRVAATDWLMYLLVTGADGDVIFDPDPCLFYRQHDANEIGYNAHFRARVHRVRALMGGRFAQWSDANLGVLSKARLTPENARILEAFIEARQANGMTAVTLLKQSDIMREGTMATRALYFAAFLGRI